MDCFKFTQDSDHCPILITYDEVTETNVQTSWNIQKANWDAYETGDAWLCMPPLHLSNKNLIEGLCDRIRIATNKAIPQTAKTMVESGAATIKERREKFYQQYRQNKTNKL